MFHFQGFQTALVRAALFIGALAGANQSAFADSLSLSVTGMVASSSVNGVTVGAGSYTIEQLEAAGTALGSVNAGGVTGISLWSILGGTSAGASNILTFTPPGDNGKNAILRSYVLATSVSGTQSIISAGEIDPFFGGTGAVPPFIAFSGTDGNPALVFPGDKASGRNVQDLASLQVLSAPALISGPGGTSTSLALTGNVARPGSYGLTDLQALPAKTTTINGDNYTGVALWDLLNPTNSDSLTQYVLASGTDGYAVLYSLAELNPALGSPEALVPYADTQGQFPSNGFARTVIPGDNRAGRYVSNLNAIEVTSSVPEPGTAASLAVPLLGFYIISRLRR